MSGESDRPEKSEQAGGEDAIDEVLGIVGLGLNLPGMLRQMREAAAPLDPTNEADTDWAREALRSAGFYSRGAGGITEAGE